MFVDALANEYNLIFALPLPVIALTDGSRLPYIVALSVLYLLPFALVVGVVCRRAFPRLGRGAQGRHAAGYRRAAGLDDGDARLSRCARRRGRAGGLRAARRRAARAVVDGAVDRLRGRCGRRHPPPPGVRQPGRARDRGPDGRSAWIETLRAYGMSAVLDDARGGRLLRATALPLAALGFLMMLNPFFVGMVQAGLREPLCPPTSCRLSSCWGHSRI